MPILAGILALAAVVLFFVGRAQGAKALDIQSTETSSAAELASLAAEVAKEIGAGSFTRVAELKGTGECAEPLVAEMTGTPCLYYRSTVTREYEERVTVTDKDGHRRTETRRGSEQVSSNERRIPFLLRDATGTIGVDPQGAVIDSERSLSRFESGAGQSLRFGNFVLELGSLAMGLGGRRTLGYRLEEWVLPLGRRLYVLGEASDADGRLSLRKPGGKGGRFIISLRSEEELVKAAKGLALGLSIGAGVLLAASLVLAVLLVLGVIP
jgi:hypothetical protein